jgi:hypothetical protein
MSKARDKRKKAKPGKKVLNKKNIKNIRTVIIVSAIIVAAVIITVLVLKANSFSQYTKTVSKDEAREEILGYIPGVSNPRALSNALRIADSFAVEDLEKDGDIIAKEAIIYIDNPDSEKSPKISQKAYMLLIIDDELNVLGLKPFKPTYFTLGIDFDKFFDEFKGKSANQFILQVDGIYTNVSNTALLIKNKVKAAMSLFYIEKYGINEYDKISKGEFIFAEKGIKIEPIETADINGEAVSLSQLKDYKLILIGGNPHCGGCVTSIKRIANEIEKYNTSNTKFLVFSFSDNLDDARKIGDQLPEETIVIQDPERVLAKQLKIDASPYIALVDKNLTLFYRGPCEPTRETLSNIKDFLGDG